MQKIIPFLWFNENAADAAKYYVLVFSEAGRKDSKITNTSYYGEGGPMPKGTVLTVDFVLDGQQFVALNGGPQFSFSEAVSFVVSCKDQNEVDYFWDNLSEGGEKVQCGWLKDKFGLSWQVVPEILGKLISDKDPEKAGRVFDVMLNMEKIEIDKLEKAYNNK